MFLFVSKRNMLAVELSYICGVILLRYFLFLPELNFRKSKYANAQQKLETSCEYLQIYDIIVKKLGIIRTCTFYPAINLN